MKHKLLHTTLLFAVAMTSAACVQSQVPFVHALMPAGGPRGATTLVKIDGHNLFDAKLIVQGSGVTVKSFKIEPDGDTAEAELEISKDAQLGPREVRVFSKKGVSNGTKLWVDPLPNRLYLTETVGNAGTFNLDLASPVVVNGRLLKKTAVDRFSLTAKAGELWLFECFCSRIHSRLDPVLELRDANNEIVKIATSAWEMDPRLAWRFAKSGRYTLSLRDAEYGGGRGYTYRLLAGKLPVVTDISPRGDLPGSRFTAVVNGQNVPQGTRVEVQIPTDSTVGQFWCAVPIGSSSQIAVPIEISENRVTCAPNSLETSLLPSAPATIDGVFIRSPRARFTFTAKKDEKTEFDLLGRRIGSRIDGEIRIQDSSGKYVAENDDAVGKDARLEFTAPKDDTYTLELNNVEGTKGSDCFYRLNMKRIHPDFKVETRSDLINVGRNSKTEFQVIVQRTGGFAGAVTVVVEGLPKGVTMIGNAIPAEKNEGKLTFSAPLDAPLATSQIRIFAEAMSINGKLRHEIRGWEQYEHRSIDLVLAKEYSYDRPHFTWNMLTLAVTDNSPAFTVDTSPDAVAINPGKKAEFTVRINRHGGNPGVVKLEFQNMPVGVTPISGEIPADKSELKVIMSAAIDAPADIPNVIVIGRVKGATASAPAMRVAVIK